MKRFEQRTVKQDEFELLSTIVTDKPLCRLIPERGKDHSIFWLAFPLLPTPLLLKFDDEDEA